MTTVKAAAMFFVFAVGTSVRSADEAGLRALIDKGIKSAGGSEKLAALKAATCKITAKSLTGDENATFSCTAFLQGADQFKLEGTVERGGVTKKAALVVNGMEAWSEFDGKVDTADKDEVLAAKHVIRAFHLVHALTPLKDKDTTLSPLGEIDLHGKTAVGLKVSGKDQKDINVFLDKETGLPVKTELRVPKKDGGESTLEFILGDYKEIGGRKHFTKLVASSDGKLTMEAVFSEIQWLEKLDASVFARP